MCIELNDSMMMAIMIATLRGNDEFEKLITLITVIKEEDASWRQMSALCTEKAKCLTQKSVINPQNSTAATGQSAQVSWKPNTWRENQAVYILTRQYRNEKCHLMR